MKKLYLASIILLHAFGCNTKNQTIKSTEKNAESRANTPVSSYQQESLEEGKDSVLILKDEFASNPFELGEDYISSLYKLAPLEVKIETHLNRHVDNQVDTSFYFLFEDSEIQIYKYPDEQLVLNAVLSEERIPLKNGIKMGMSKEDFVKYLPLVNKRHVIKDTIKIYDVTAIQNIEFIFQKNQLRRISFEGYFD
jgi:hypothetical protein